ncbi:MAG: FAD-dependent oxidoreductase [Candidatus Moranbacteria bacterium]|nr:FAD-dependent oxidoreductase [Candidatus Moranbacteria bacterium]MDD3965250.1 FAD-dependent oxidoreductase [Candidatus Moranbacteria bacterium]
MKKNSNTFDVIVIGAGSGGLNIAGFMNRVGFSVLLVDKEDRSIGGDCLNFGCVPSKALIHVARLVHDGREAKKFGLTISGAIDVKKVMEYVSKKQETIRTHENADHFRKLGMTVVLGKAQFVDSETIEVAGKQYCGKKIILATGSRPRQLSIPGIELMKVFTNETIFSLNTLPERLVVIGAGPIGIELGQSLALLGTKVTVVGSGLLDKEDPEMVSVLRERLEKDGVDFLLGYRPKAVKDGKVLVVSNEVGETREILADALLVSIGRELNLDGLNLESAGIEVNDRGGLIVDSYLRTTNKGVLVCGDVAGGHMFTHAAELHASLIIKNFFSPIPKKLNADAMAWVTYTSPEIATFGLDEKTLRERSVDYDVLKSDFLSDDRAIVDEYVQGKMKLFVSRKGIVLGGTMVAHNAGELTQELMFAQANKLSLKKFLNKVYPYPTATRINRSIALQFMSRKLTDQSKKLLAFLFHMKQTRTSRLLALGVIVFGFVFVLYTASIEQDDVTLSAVRPDLKNQVFANHLQYVDYSPESYVFAKQSGRVVLFFAATTWCSNCVVLDQEIRERLNELPQDVIVVKVDFDKDREMKIKHKVTLQTTLILLGSEGKEVKRWIGTDFNQLLDNIR